LRKDRGVGIIPGGKAAMEAVLTGHGHDKIKVGCQAIFVLYSAGGNTAGSVAR